LSDASISALISAASGISGAIVGGVIAARGAIKAVEKTSGDLELTEIRRQKVRCLVALYGLRWVVSDAPNIPDDYKAQFNEINKVPALWADDAEVMKTSETISFEKTTERLIQLLRTLGNTTALPIERLGDADVRGVFHVVMSGRRKSVSG
jgi:hypothetical protein